MFYKALRIVPINSCLPSFQFVMNSAINVYPFYHFESSHVEENVENYRESDGREKYCDAEPSC